MRALPGRRTVLFSRKLIRIEKCATRGLVTVTLCLTFPEDSAYA
jgi:hypothetical protein